MIIRILFLNLCFIQCYAANAQQDGLIEKLQQLTLAKDSLEKQVIRPLKDSIQLLNVSSQNRRKDVERLKDSIHSLQVKIKSLEGEVSGYKNAGWQEKIDSLQKQILLLNSHITGLKDSLLASKMLVIEERRKGEEQAKRAKESGKIEALNSIIYFYTSNSFDSLILKSNKYTLQRDLSFIGNFDTVKTVLQNLQKYYNAETLLSQKYNADACKIALTSLGEVKEKSASLIRLIEDIEYYKVYNSQLVNTINNIILLDSKTTAGGTIEVQKLKFKSISNLLAEYRRDYYDFNNYPYLNTIFLEIIKRKSRNADTDVTDLIQKL